MTTSATSPGGASAPSAGGPAHHDAAAAGLAGRDRLLQVAVHFDVDTVDSNEIVPGLGAEPDGLTTAEVRRIVADIGAVSDVVGLTVAEFIPRQVMHLQRVLTGFPLIAGRS